MSYVIMNVGTERLYRKPGQSYCSASYKTERAAKGVCTRLNREYSGFEMQVDGGRDVVQWVAMSREAYATAHPVKMVERTNAMTGQKYMEAEDTPRCCSPASELYWTM